jgi:HK97 family phage portal protein
MEIMNQRQTEPPRESSYSIWLPQNDAGVSVTHENALQFSAVWACVRVISETVSQLKWSVFQQQADGGRDELTTHPAFRLLAHSPNSEMSAFTFREVMLAHALTWGNAYAEIERDGAFRPIGLWPISPERVEVLRDEDFSLFYRIHNPQGGHVNMPAADVFHIRGLGNTGTEGYSVIRMAAQTIGLGKVQEQAGASFWRNGARPGGILTPAGMMTAEARQSLERQWSDSYGGGKNFNRVALLSHDLKYTPLGIPQDDAQFLDSRRFSIEDICRWFRVPPHKVGDLQRATFSNIEHQSIEFVTDTVVPWAIRLEQEADAKLISGSQRRIFTKILLQSLLRGDSAARATYYREMRDLGVLSINEIRKLEDLNPIGADGDLRLEPPEPPPAPAAAPPAEDGEEIPAQDIWKPLIRSGLNKVIQRELKGIKAPLAKGGSVANFYKGHASYVKDQLGDICCAVGKVLGYDTSAVLDQLIVEHMAASQFQIDQAEMSYDNLQQEWTVNRVDEQTDWLITALWKGADDRS